MIYKGEYWEIRTVRVIPRTDENEKRLKEKLKREGWKIMNIAEFESAIKRFQKNGTKYYLRMSHWPENYDFFIMKLRKP